MNKLDERNGFEGHWQFGTKDYQDWVLTQLGLDHYYPKRYKDKD